TAITDSSITLSLPREGAAQTDFATEIRCCRVSWKFSVAALGGGVSSAIEIGWINDLMAKCFGFRLFAGGPLLSNQTIVMDGNGLFHGSIQFSTKSVSQLPDPTVSNGMMYLCNDLLSTTPGASPTGGHSGIAFVRCLSNAWVVF